MNAKQLEAWISDNYLGLLVTDAYRERSFFYNPDKSLPKGVYFATIKEKDGPNDTASNLNREGIYRFSLGIGKRKFTELFGNIPARPAKGEIINVTYDFTAIETLMPHPIYAWIGWICINNPNYHNMDFLKHLLDITYQNAVHKFNKKR